MLNETNKKMTTQQIKNTAFENVMNSAKNVVYFAIKNNNSNITVKRNNGNEARINNTANENVIYCAHNYAKVNDVVVMKVVVNGNKAADCFYSAIANLENNYNVKSQFINDCYVALLLSPKMKIL